VLLQLEEMTAAYDLLKHQVEAMRDETRTLKQQLQQLEAMAHTSLLEHTAMRAALRESHVMIWQLQNLLEHVNNIGELLYQAWCSLGCAHWKRLHRCTCTHTLGSPASSKNTMPFTKTWARCNSLPVLALLVA